MQFLVSMSGSLAFFTVWFENCFLGLFGLHNRLLVGVMEDDSFAAVG